MNVARADRAKLILLLAAALCAGRYSAAGMFLKPDLEKIPVERLIANLEARVAAHPDDAEAHYALGRVHAIAYARQEGELSVDKRTGQPYVGDGPRKDYPPAIAPVAGTAEMKQRAQRHLEAAIKSYRQAVTLNKEHLPAQLGLSWSLDQHGDRGLAREQYRKTLELAWAKEKGAEHIFVSSVVEEVAGYLLPLLDPKSDAAEITKIKGYQKQIKTKPRAVTPILVPLLNDLTLDDLVQPAVAVDFDLSGSRLGERWGWISPNAGWLVYDSGRSGKITSGLQLFGNVTFWIFWPNGYDALAALDDDASGELSGPELTGLALWHDKNSNGLSEPGEVKPLREHGITALGCRGQQHPSRILFCPNGARFADGQWRPTYDWIAPGRPMIAPPADR